MWRVPLTLPQQAHRQDPARTPERALGPSGRRTGEAWGQQLPRPAHRVLRRLLWAAGVQSPSNSKGGAVGTRWIRFPHNHLLQLHVESAGKPREGQGMACVCESPRPALRCLCPQQVDPRTRLPGTTSELCRPLQKRPSHN